MPQQVTDTPAAAAPHGTPGETGLAAPPSVGELFRTFMILGLTSFGGALPYTRGLVVEQKRWLSGDEFAELLGLCQFLPGGNIINLSVALGVRFQGVRGALASMLGFIAVPTAVVLVFGVIYDKSRGNPHVEHLFAALAAAAAGLLIAVSWKIAKPLRGKWGMIAIAAACFVAIAVLRYSLLPTMLLLTPVSIFITWRSGK